MHLLIFLTSRTRFARRGLGVAYIYLKAFDMVLTGWLTKHKCIWFSTERWGIEERSDRCLTIKDSNRQKSIEGNCGTLLL